jgi:hypothetical protein
MVAGHSLDFMTKDERERLESLLGSPVVLVSLQEPADMPKADWNEALALDAICRRIESTLRVRGEYKQAERHSVQVLSSQKFLVTGMRVRRWSNIQIGLANPRRWASGIGARGMEIIGGRLVLGLVTELNENDNEAEVLLVEQGRGMSVVPAIAKVIKGKSGGWAIQGQTDTRHPALEVLCVSVARGREPDDKVWKASQFVRIAREIGSFEPLEPRLIEADGGRGDN